MLRISASSLSSYTRVSLQNKLFHTGFLHPPRVLFQKLLSTVHTREPHSMELLSRFYGFDEEIGTKTHRMF